MVNLDNLFKKIKSMGLNMKKVAVGAGVPFGVLSDWKRGKSFPSCAKLIVVADYLNCSMDYLLGRTNTEKVVNLPDDFIEIIQDTFKGSAEEFISEKDIVSLSEIYTFGFYIVNDEDFEKVLKIYDKVSSSYSKSKIPLSKEQYISLFEKQGNNYILLKKDYCNFHQIYKLYVKTFILE